MDTKYCSGCKYRLSLDSFGNNRTRSDGKQSYCKLCTKSINRKSYLAGRGTQNPKRSASKLKQRDVARQFVIQYLFEHPCVDCGEDDVLFLQFDHQRDKIRDIGYLLARSGLPSIKREIEKCDVVCVKCHILRTAIAFNWWRVPYSAVAQLALAERKEVT